MTYGSFLFPPQIHLEQEDPLNLDEENDNDVTHDEPNLGVPKFFWEFSYTYISIIKRIFVVTMHFPISYHFPCQDSRGPLAQDGSVEDRGSFHKSSCMYFMPT